MNNRVDYLSDKLVNLRGKLKNVEEVVPKDSIANGVSINHPTANTASSAAKNQQQAQERRREQTSQLHADYEQRLLRRQRQLKVKAEELAGKLARINELSNSLQNRQTELEKLRLDDSETLSQSALGERFRTIDRKRLEFFAEDGEIELMLMGENTQQPQSVDKQGSGENFKNMLKKGWALALSLGVVVGIFVIIAALIIFQGWR